MGLMRGVNGGGSFKDAVSAPMEECPNCRGGNPVKPTLRRAVAALAVISLATVAGLSHHPASAADDGSVSFSITGPDTILYGENPTYTLTASKSGGGGDGYNLTFRQVLPAGVSFVSSSGGGPTAVVADAPGAGQTTLLFENVADLQAGVTRSITVTVDVSEASYAVGSTVAASGGAYVSSDPRLIPDFDASGAHADNGDTSAIGTGSTSTRIEAIRLTKTEPDTEAELLRGVHTEWTTYSLLVENNLVNPSDSLTVEDYLPAGLEFLGCGGVDNTEDTPVTNPGAGTEEYPGSGALGVGVTPTDPTGGPAASCETATSVTTVTLAADEQFPGQAAGVYTHVTWDLTAIVGTMAPGAQFELMYAAGIPLRENAASFSAGHTNTDHTADLDNNSGPPTTDEQELTNWSRASATYWPGTADLATSDTDSSTVSAEDLSIHKSVDDGVFTQTETPAWTMLIETGEYRSASGLVVTDTLPDGQCPIPSAGDPETPDATGECAQPGGLPAPTVGGVTDDADTVTENSDGSWTLVWSTIPDLTTNDDLTISFTSRIRRNYQESFLDDVPVVGADAFTNNVDLSGTTTPIDDAGTPLDRAVETTVDGSRAGQAAAIVVIDKSISQPTPPGVTLDCDSAVWTTETPPTPDQAGLAYRPGDRVCYRIVVDFLSDLHYRNPVVTDFIPPNTVFERFWGDDPATGQVLGAGPGADVTIDAVYDVETGPGTAPSGTTDEGLEWTLGSTVPNGGGDLYVSNLAEHFEVVFSVVISGDPRDVTSVDIFDNLAKLTLQNNDNNGAEKFSDRDQARYPHAEPHVVLDKRNGPSGGSLDDGAETAVQLDEIDYEVEITNDFADLGVANPYATASDTRFWDVLPPELACADITTGPTLSTGETVTCLDPGDGGYPLGGQASDGRSVLQATILTLAPQASSTLSYSVTLPATLAAGDTLVNDAGVRDYVGSDSNADSPTGTVYYPADNIDEANAGLANADPADDQAVVNVPGVAVTKVQTSGDTDPSGGTNRANTPASDGEQDATIGETVTYTFAVTIPEGTDLHDATVVDSLDTELDFVGFVSGSLSLDAGTTLIPLTITGGLDDAYFDVDGSTTENAGDVAVDVATDVVSVTFPPTWSNDAGSLDDLLSVTLDTIVDDAIGVDAGDTIDNLISVSSDDAQGEPVPTVPSPTVRTLVVEPNPRIAKTDDGTDTDTPSDGDSNVAPGDRITYSLTVTNPDTGGDTSAAWDIEVSDVLPEGVSFAPGGADNPQGGTWAPGTPGGSEGTITWTQTEVPALAGLAVGDSVTLQYTVTVDDPAIASRVLTNTAEVTAESRDAESAGERTSYVHTATDTVELPPGRLAKDVAPFDADPFDGSDIDDTDYAVGEPVDFELTIEIPEDQQVFDATVFDTLPAFVEFESYGTPVIGGPSCERIGGGSLVPGDVVTLTGNGQTLGWYIGDLLADGAACRITLPYTGHIDDSATTANIGPNSATLVWHVDDVIAVDPSAVTDLAAEVWDETVGPEIETISVIEPLLVIDKDVVVLDPGPTACEPSPDADTCDTESGAVHRFTVTVTNTGDGPAHDVEIVDTLPTEGASDPTNLTGSPVAVFDGAGPRTLTWDVTGPIAAGGGSVTFTYDVTVGPSAVLEDDQGLANTAAVTSYWGLSEADRESAPNVPINADVPEYHVDRSSVTPDAVTLTVEFPDLVLVKTPAAGMDATDARVGQDFRWRLEVFNDGNQGAYDVDVDDVLPTGWVYQAGSATLDTGSGPIALADPTGGPSGPLVWTDVVASVAAGGSFAIEFDVQPQPSLLAPATTGSFGHVNDGGVDGDDASGASANQTGAYGDDNDGPDGARGSDNDVARIRRIDLELDKQIVESAPHYYGDFVTYRITVTNDDTGPTVDTATDVEIRDALPTGVVYDSSATANGSYDPGTDTWALATPLAGGDTATLDIVVRINSPIPFTNHAEVESAGQWDLDSTPGNWDGGTGTNEDDSVSASLFPTNADLGNRLWFDVDADGDQDAGEPGIPGVDVTVSWIDPADGITVVTRSTTTNAEGEYGFDDIPQDLDLTVTVDGADLPGGLVPTFELADSPVVTDPQGANGETGAFDGVTAGIVLTGTNPSYLDVDFGYTGTGSLGDRVWYDLDGDGVQDGDEVGLDSVGVIVDWAGFDGRLGDDPATVGVDESLDDVRYTTATAGGGLYGVGNLPAGDHTVSVTTGDLPAGIDVPTWDPEFAGSGDPADLGNVSSYALAAGEDHDGVDFGYVGPGALADIVWLDLDGDGELDPDEVGLPAVTVTVEFVAPGGATISRTVDTAADGTYRFEGLPLDTPITVSIDPSDLPGNVSATHDLDDPADGSSTAGTTNTATVTLTSAEPEESAADFGYVGAGALGDTVWLDLDASGEPAPQTDDVLLPGVGVTITWTNPGGSDLVVETTTGVDGTYLATGLPDGDYTVTIDAATLPAGVNPMVDPDGGADNTSAVVLDDDPGTPGVNEGIDLDQDFAYVGTGSLGDLVWNDLDASGTVGAGEAGINGVEVTIMWTDPVTGATATITTTTAGGGSYGVGMLPAGDYVISIDPTTLPEGMAPTFDLDGGLDRTVTAVLAPGEDRSDIDFGERREADLALTKASDGAFAVGSEEIWTVSVTNLGPAIADGTITVADTLPAGTTPVRVDATGWTCEIDGPDLTCTHDGPALAVDATTTLDVVVAVDATAAPGVTNTAMVTLTNGPPDPNPDNDADDDPVDVPLALLGVEKELLDELITGRTARWRIVVTNHGPSATNGPYTITDELPVGLEFTRAETDDLSCSASGRVGDLHRRARACGERHRRAGHGHPGDRRCRHLDRQHRRDRGRGAGRRRTDRRGDPRRRRRADRRRRRGALGRHIAQPDARLHRYQLGSARGPGRGAAGSRLRTPGCRSPLADGHTTGFAGRSGTAIHVQR